MFDDKKRQMVSPDEALAGRSTPLAVASRHFVLGNSMSPPFPEGMERAMFGLGCFWGAERCFWQLDGVWSSAVGYAAGFTENPSYEEVCSGKTGHNEVVSIVFDSNVVTYHTLLQTFWQSHNPTHGMQQGNDIGTQYRSGIYCFNDGQYNQAIASRDSYQSELHASGFGAITTEIVRAPEFYYAEDYHQQYLAKNPNGYCGLGGTGVACVPAE